MKCPNCGAEVPAGATLCPDCGAALQPRSRVTAGRIVLALLLTFGMLVLTLVGGCFFMLIVVSPMGNPILADRVLAALVIPAIWLLLGWSYLVILRRLFRDRGRRVGR